MCYYKVNVVICMVLRRYVLKSLSTLSHWLLREKVWNISRTCISQTVSVKLSSTVRSFLSQYHGYHIFVHLFRVFRHSGPLLLWESFFHQFDQAFDLIDYPCWVSQCFLFVFMCLPMKAYRASIFLNKHAVDMFNEFLFSLGDFG